MAIDRNPVSAPQNLWFDSEQVDADDLTLEQNFNNSINTAIINNHIGSGNIPDTLVQNILFDSSKRTGYLDGIAIYPDLQPSDTNFGNQLEITLSNSAVFGNRRVKLAIIGLDFEDNLISETFVFNINETQISYKHFKSILVLFFNDLIGLDDQSFNLGGTLVIKEAKSLEFSRDCLMLAQNTEPSLFWRDFFVAGNISLNTLLTNSLPLYNIDNLNINTGYKENKLLIAGDVNTQLGQKFAAITNNIQKITLLLAVQNTEIGMETNLVWDGDLIVSIYPLQSSVNCITDIVPNLPIDFPPNNLPLGQLSFNYTTLRDRGIVLDNIAQPVDFIFSNTSVASGNTIIPGQYYAFTIKRSGSATVGDIIIVAGTNTLTDSKATAFSGDVWVDLDEDDLWFEIYTDSAKISDGQFYENGNGAIINKTEIVSNTTFDYVLRNIEFAGNDTFTAALSATTLKSERVQDQRTGNLVYSQQQFVPELELFSTLELANLQDVSNPLIVGKISDKNRKFNDTSVISASFHSFGMSKNKIVLKIIDDIFDPRYDANVNSLVSSILNGDLIEAKFIPNPANSNTYYRVGKAKICSMLYGDVDGNGIIDNNDLIELNKLIGYDLNSSPSLDGYYASDGYTAYFDNGYLNLSNLFVNASSLLFQILNPTTNDVLLDGYDGILIANPLDKTTATFNSALFDFNVIPNITDYKLLINTTISENKGGFEITGLNSINNTLSIKKIYYNSDNFLKVFRADIDGDFSVSLNDGYLLEQYINKVLPINVINLIAPSTPTTPYSKIGTKFNAIEFTLEKFIDRKDDYSSTDPNRNLDIHSIVDVFAADGYFANNNYLTTPIAFNMQKQFSWENFRVIVKSGTKETIATFVSNSGYVLNDCNLSGLDCEIYPTDLEFDKGKTDFYVPNNIIIKDGGELQRPDGNAYKIDMEVGTITLEIPDGIYGTERTLNIFDNFVAEYNDTGLTRLGFPALKFSDCSKVQSTGLTNNQVRFSVSVQSFSPNTNGLDDLNNPGVIVDGKMGIAINYTTGLLKLNFTNLYQDPTQTTLNTKVQIQVFLKKGGFNNEPIYIDSVKVKNLLDLINI